MLKHFRALTDAYFINKSFLEIPILSLVFYVIPLLFLVILLKFHWDWLHYFLLLEDI